MYLDPFAYFHDSHFFEIIGIEIKNAFPIDIVLLKSASMMSAIVDGQEIYNLLVPPGFQICSECDVGRRSEECRCDWPGVIDGRGGRRP